MTTLTGARRDPAVTVWVVAGACWLLTAWLVVSGGHELGHHDVVLDGSPWPWPWPMRIAGFLAVWLVMIGAMMLPTVVPLVRLFAVVAARAPRPGRALAALGAGYVAVWAAFAPIALLGDTGVHALVDRWAWLAARPELVMGATLTLAGLFQFSRLKNACLTACRSPVGVVWQHYGRGAGAAWRMGLRHGLSCLGCCWALMLVMFGTGVGSLAWMLALTAVMVAEKTTRWGARLVTPVGSALLAAGLTVSIGGLL